MASNILSIGTSALNAAQVGLSTTGHNIANASTPGYSRQVVVQSAAQAQNFGYGYIGQGTEISAVTRVYNEILARQVVNSQAVSSGVDVYSSNLGAIENMLSDASVGLNPALNDFFASVQSLSANPGDTPTRQTMLSYAQSLVNRFQSTNNRLNEIRDSVNTQLTSSVNMVNSYAKQIARLNDVIEKAVNSAGNPPNDLMDQRDQLVLELSKQIKTTVVPQNQGSYNIFIGNGLPLVVGTVTNSLITTSSPTDPGRLEVAYQNKTKTTVLGVDSLPGGAIGGLLQFRSESLDTVQNQLGQIAVVLAETFNAQHAQGLDKNGNPGGALFSIPDPAVSSNWFWRKPLWKRRSGGAKSGSFEPGQINCSSTKLANVAIHTHRALSIYIHPEELINLANTQESETIFMLIKTDTKNASGASYAGDNPADSGGWMAANVIDNVFQAGGNDVFATLSNLVTLRPSPTLHASGFHWRPGNSHQQSAGSTQCAHRLQTE